LADGDDAETEDLSRRLGWLLHIDEPARLRVQGRAFSHPEGGQVEAPLSPMDQRRIGMLDVQLWPRGEVRSVGETIRAMTERPAIAEEVAELHQVLDDRIAVASAIYPVPEWPLCLHHHYSRREIVAAVGFVGQGEKKKSLQGGILTLKDRPCELLFVTLDKTGAGFSPTTRYRDYAISSQLFHWETQGAASVSRPSGRRYIESPGNGMSFQLFVRTAPDEAFAYLGPVTYQRHAGDRPIAITWKLEHPMAAGLFERYATLASG
jgi:hypothetical protein